MPQVVKRINNTLLRADQLHHAKGDHSIDFLQPIVADAEAGFGGVLNAYELMKAMIEAGAAGVHFEDQLASVKKCGHMGGKVLVPTREAIEKLTAEVASLLLMRGHAKANLQLTIPFATYQPLVKVSATVEQAEVGLADSPVQLTNVSGAITFDESAGLNGQLAGKLWNEAAQVELSGDKRGSQ